MTKHDARYLSAIPPETLELYLDSTGWTRGDETIQYVDYHRETLTIFVPRRQAFRDYGACVLTFIGELGRLEGRPGFEVVAAIQAMADKP